MNIKNSELTDEIKDYAGWAKANCCIEVGKLADFVVLSENHTKVDPFVIKDIKVEKTIIGGKIVYEQ